MNKQQFLASIANSQQSAQQAAELLAQIPNSEFNELNVSLTQINPQYRQLDDLNDYLSNKLGVADYNFSKELCQHLVDIKRYIQQGINVNNAVEKNSVEEKQSNENIQLVKPSQNEESNTQSAVKNNEVEQLVADFVKQGGSLLQGYTPTAKQAQAIQNKDIKAVKHDLLFMLTNNRVTAKAFLQAVLYAYEKCPSAFVEYDVKKFYPAINLDENAWDKNYFLDHNSYLNSNFSLERLLHLYNVRDTLNKKGEKGFEYIETNKTTDEPKQTYQPQTESKPTVSQSTQSARTQPHNTNSSYEQHQSTSQPKEPEVDRPNDENSFIKKCLMIGGAIAAAILALIAVFRR